MVGSASRLGWDNIGRKRIDEIDQTHELRKLGVLALLDILPVLNDPQGRSLG